MRFYREHIDGAFTGSAEEFTVIHCDRCGNFSVGEERRHMFVDAFWTAELHGKSEGETNRGIVGANVFYGKLFLPLLSLTSVLLLLLILSSTASAAATWRIKSLESAKGLIGRIIERRSLRDEVTAFVDGKSRYLEHLNTMNVLRPATLLFNDFETRSQTEVLCVGMCDSSGTLHAFIDRLKKSGAVRDAVATDVVARQKSTSFNLRVEFL
jgi:hypothetical protein